MKLDDNKRFDPEYVLLQFQHPERVRRMLGLEDSSIILSSCGSVSALNLKKRRDENKDLSELLSRDGLSAFLRSDKRGGNLPQCGEPYHPKLSERLCSLIGE